MTPAAGRGTPRAAYSVDLVLLAPRDGALHLLVERAGGARSAFQLPWALPKGVESLTLAARSLARRRAGAEPGWMEQLHAFGDPSRHPGQTAVSIAYVGVVNAPAARGRLAASAAWVPVASAGLTGRHATILSAALEALRHRLDVAPIAFKLLPATFTLSELQGMYELLLGWPLHKASFRRSLQAAYLVEPTDEWRSEGRGRPAQLYRYSPRKRRRARRGVRFDVLGQ